jgi:hypothetical protein
MADKPVSSKASSELGSSAGGRPQQLLTFAVEEQITSKNIQKLLERVYVLAGCRDCGLVGYDVRLQLVNPAIRTEFKGIEGVADVNIAAGAHL